MLVLTRCVNQAVKIGHEVTVTVLGFNAGQVRIGVEAPREISVDRQEIRKRKQEQEPPKR